MNERNSWWYFHRLAQSAYILVRIYTNAGSTLGTISIWFYYVASLLIGKMNNNDNLEIININIHRVFKNVIVCCKCKKNSIIIKCLIFANNFVFQFIALSLHFWFVIYIVPYLVATSVFYCCYVHY